jgi:hypothetical protein
MEDPIRETIFPFSTARIICRGTCCRCPLEPRPTLTPVPPTAPVPPTFHPSPSHYRLPSLSWASPRLGQLPFMIFFTGRDTERHIFDVAKSPLLFVEFAFRTRSNDPCHRCKPVATFPCGLNSMSHILPANVPFPKLTIWPPFTPRHRTPRSC